MQCKRLIAALSAIALAATMAACGSENETEEQTSAQSSTQAEQRQEPTNQVRTYTQADIDSVNSECESKNVAGEDILDTITNDGDVILTTISGTGITSDVYQCVIDALELPDEIVDAISKNTYGTNAKTDYSNLHLLWSTDGATVKNLYISLEEFE